MTFKKNKQAFTVGIELEIQLLDSSTLNLNPASDLVLEKLKNHTKFIREMFQSTIEIISEPHLNMQQLENDVAHSIGLLENTCTELGIDLASTGTHPKADYNERLVSRSARYSSILEKNQWLIRRMAVYGLHIHIGLKNGDQCIQFMDFFHHFLPHLIALSSSSPFWKSKDTGLNASRPTVYESHPTAGPPEIKKNWDAFVKFYHQLLETGSIESMKDIWWDIRPSPGHGTLEIRICDMPATLAEVMAITAFTQLLAVWFENQDERFKSSFLASSVPWIYRENKWRAIRYGLDAEIIKHASLQPVKMKDDILFWLNEFKPFIKEFKYEKYTNIIHSLLKSGNSATRQRNIYQLGNFEIDNVVKFNVSEFKKRVPDWEYNAPSSSN